MDIVKIDKMQLTKNCISNTYFLDYFLILRLAVKRFVKWHWISHLFPLPCGAGSTVPRERFDSSVIMPGVLWLWRFLYSVCPHQVSSLHINTFVVSWAFMAGAASQAGDADSSRAPGLTSGLQGSMNVHRGALLFAPQRQCISSFVFYITAFKQNRESNDGCSMWKVEKRYG